MSTTNQEICEQFSMGNFPFSYEYFADNVEWIVIGNESTKGKENVIGYCDKMMQEMTSSKLKNTNVIAGENKFAIEGTCDFIDEEDNPGEVAYCDVYLFEEGKIARITSYCI